MKQCRSCQGFVPPSYQQCPHCDRMIKTSAARSWKLAANLFLGSSLTMTLSACYGTPPPMPECDPKIENQGACVTSSPSPTNSGEPSPPASESPVASASPSAAPTVSPQSTASPSPEASTKP